MIAKIAASAARANVRPSFAPVLRIRASMTLPLWNRGCLLPCSLPPDRGDHIQKTNRYCRTYDFLNSSNPIEPSFNIGEAEMGEEIYAKLFAKNSLEPARKHARRTVGGPRKAQPACSRSYGSVT